ncbi:MAG: nuclear transport factor 2 family protein [Actinomycetota bacterium]
MPWFPDFANAVELARRQTRAAGQADPVAQYFTALNGGNTEALETVWPGEVVIYDPRAGEIHGHRQLRRFVGQNQSWMAEHRVRTETVAATSAGGRAVVELLAHLPGDEGERAWPVAVVAESPDDRSVVFRTYCSQLPVDGRRHVRPPILESGPIQPGDVIGRYQAALGAGDTEAVVSTFAADGYFREPIGPHLAHPLGQESASTNAAPTGCWPRFASTTTWQGMADNGDGLAARDRRWARTVPRSGPAWHRSGWRR